MFLLINNTIALTLTLNAAVVRYFMYSSFFHCAMNDVLPLLACISQRERKRSEMAQKHTTYEAAAESSQK